MRGPFGAAVANGQQKKDGKQQGHQRGFHPAGGKRGPRMIGKKREQKREPVIIVLREQRFGNFSPDDQRSGKQA